MQNSAVAQLARHHADETKVACSSRGPTLLAFGSWFEAFYLANSQFYSLDFKSIVARILLINSICFLMGVSMCPLITHRCQKNRSVSLRFNFSELCSEPRRARGATSTAEISKTLRRNPIIFYKIVEGGHIKESWAGFLNRTNIESDAWEVEIELLVW